MSNQKSSHGQGNVSSVMKGSSKKCDIPIFGRPSGTRHAIDVPKPGASVRVQAQPVWLARLNVDRNLGVERA
jgi:hypothetical protein